MQEAYQYSVLESDDHIRLITLEPGDFDDELVVSVNSASFDEATRLGYTALSYVWGDESDPARVYVRDDSDATSLRYRQVTRNLEVALRYLRERQSPLRLWIDALCINQADSEEKSTQVRRMGDIYRLASRVVAWLGRPSTRSKQGLEWLAFFGTEIQYDRLVYKLTPAENATDAQLGMSFVPLHIDADSGLLEALVDIMERSWFRRLWIRQEILLANAGRALVQCGDTRVPWLIVKTALCGFRVKAINITRQQGTVQREAQMNEMIKRFFDARETCQSVAWQSVPIPLSALRRQTQRAECKDDRDRVFAALDMILPLDKELGIVPDYTKSAAQVYHDLTVQHLEYFQRPDILFSCSLGNGCNSGPDHVSNLPSWVPNFAEPLLTVFDLPGHASGDLLGPHSISDCPKRGANTILRIWGVPGATIHELAAPYKLMGATLIDRLKAIVSALLPSSSFACGLDDLHSSQGGTVLEHYATTLLGYISLKENNAREENLPSLKVSVEILRTLLAYRASQEGSIDDQTFIAQYLGVAHSMDFIGPVGYRMIGLRVALSTDQHLLLVPESARKGDQVCTLLGWWNTMLLRPPLMPRDEPDKYRVVGPCYASNMTFGDALLGPLPSGIRIHRSFGDFTWIWLNTEDEVISQYDPRMETLLEKLPEDLTDSYRKRREQKRSSWTGLHVDLDILQEHRRSVNATGGDLRCFELV